jgi:RecQ family ATP-dependent DNA helicase
VKKVDGKSMNLLLKGRFGFSAFRPHQEGVCHAVTAGADVLLVMPTGSGKSLCYQLPGIARGGTTLVISPLIALIEDQVARLLGDGFKAARIHSGRAREESRQVCKDYLAGALDFLFIAPERLSVPGFPELLARRKPTLVAVDEAHCISHWGHDFRPDYRLLGERLPHLRPAPIIALTATATVRVQEDIVKGLGLASAQLFIKGFWRDNLAVEAKECPRKERHALVASLLKDKGATPAIVYVPTRKEADALATTLAGLKAVPYHAGMEPEHRSRSQQAFMADEAAIVVATVAFGMGVDKADIRTVIHTSLSGSIENYYQEIGRAGRDSRPARAILLYAWADRKLLEFLHSHSYPAPDALRKVLRKVPRVATALEELFPEEGRDELVMASLRQLYNHGAIDWGVDQTVRRLDGAHWSRTYVAQRNHRLGQIEDMVSFAQSGGCRMQRLVAYFSPTEAGDRQCGQCDHCAPADARARAFRRPDRRELKRLEALVEAVSRRPGLTIKQLHGVVCPSGHPNRDAFQTLVDCLTRGGFLEQVTDAFDKDGRTITYQRVFLGKQMRSAKGLKGMDIWLDG